MGRKVRTISVNGQKFVWWYKISEQKTKVNVSPFGDKTSVVSIVFPDRDERPCYQSGFLYNESVVMTRGDEEYCVKIVAPKMAGLILTYLTEQNQKFVTRKVVILNGFELLAQMGYQVTEVKPGLYW